MAAISKKDRSMLYWRATQLSDDAEKLEQWADQLNLDGFVDLPGDHRTAAASLRAIAAKCRKWADGAQDD